MPVDTDQQNIGVVAKNSTDYIKCMFEILRRGDVAVTLQSDSDEHRKLLANVEEIVVPEDGTGWISDLSYPVVESDKDQLAQILFTSGTEGKSKAILLTHAALANTTDRLVSSMEITAKIREYVGVPVFYSFGFGRCRAVSRVGGSLYIPPNGFDPSEIADMLSRDEINAISAVPTLWRVLLQSSELFTDIGKNLRWIEIGSQYMSRSEKEQLKGLFPNAMIVQHYGLTEASRSTFLKIHETEGEQLESVGQAKDGVHVDINDAGQIRIKGPHLALAVLSESGREPLSDADGWFTTSDSGSIKDGLVYFEGRSDDLINCGGTKLSPDLIEQRLCAQFKVRDGIAVSKTNDSLRGEVPLIAVLASSDIEKSRVEDAAVLVLREMGLVAGKVAKVIETDVFPRTETGKLQRKKLTHAYELDQPVSAEDLSTLASAQPLSATSGATQQLVEIWQDVLKIKPVSVQDSFFDLGGDSLSAISVTMRMEKAGIPKDMCRKIFEGLSIAQIVALSNQDQLPIEPASTAAVANLAVDKTQQLVSIWEDVLKVSPISVDDSFFDLGGDSLSAISVTMKMEKAGIPKETCRRIFEGLSIAQIVATQSAGGPDDPAEATSVAQTADDQDKTQQLVHIWEEVLKVSPISVDDSFFDLGGDSLSAISVTMKMEKAGIPKETCRRIFEGWSIARIVETQSSFSAEAAQPDLDKTAELIAIWEEVLKVSPISIRDSFFDLGGDSLSAITVTMKMEKAGIPKETCRKIFEGLSIADIVCQQTDSLPEDGPAKIISAQVQTPEIAAGSKTPLAAASESLNIVRGILVLLNVASHWMPGVMARIPGVFSEINKYFAPLYSSGTPGFAIVFGSGLGFFFLPRFLKDPASVRAVVIRNTMLLAAGISLYALLSTLAAYILGEPISGLDIMNSFWSVLTFYLLAVISLPVWLRLLTLSKSFSFSCLALASVFYAIHLLVVDLDIPPSENPLIQFFVLVLTAKYNYFEMSSGVLIGAAVGNWIRIAVVEGASIKPFALAGVFLIFAAVVISYEMGESALWFVWPKGLSLWTWPFYLGLVLIAIVLVQTFVATQSLKGRTEQLFKTLAIIGIMAFPIFIAHELVIPVKNMLTALGVPLALPIALSAFFIGSGYLVHRLYSVYYGRSPFSLGR